MHTEYHGGVRDTFQNKALGKKELMHCGRFCPKAFILRYISFIFYFLYHYMSCTFEEEQLPSLELFAESVLVSKRIMRA